MLKPCNEWAEQLSAYLDGALSPAEIPALETHLRECEACRATLELYRCDAQDAAAALQTRQASASFAAQVMAQVRGESQQQGSRYVEMTPAAPKRKWRSLRLLEWGALAVLPLIFASLLFPTFSKAREKSRQSSCMSNQKQLALMVNIYAQEQQLMLPSSTRWIEEIGAPPKMLRCVNAHDLQVAYAYNRDLSGRKLDEFKGVETDTPLTFDARDGKPAFRHNAGLIISFLDGHVEFKKQFTVSSAAVTIAPPHLNYGLAERLLIAYTAHLALLSRDVQASMEEAERTIVAHKGFILASEYTRGKEHTLDAATISGRVPSEELGTLLQTIGGLGTLTIRTVNGEDLTDRQLANTSQLTQLHGSQDRLQQLAPRTRTVDSAMQLGKEQDEKTSAANELRVDEYRLKSRVRLAEVTVDIREETPPAPGISYGGIADKSISALAAFGKALLYLLIPLLIWSPVWGIALGITLYIRRRRQAKAGGAS